MDTLRLCQPSTDPPLRVIQSLRAFSATLFNFDIPFPTSPFFLYPFFLHVLLLDDVGPT